MRFAMSLCAVLLVLFLGGCADTNTETYKPEYQAKPLREETVYSFGIHPLHNPERLHAVYGPVTDWLSEQVPGVRFKLEASRNYAAFDEKLYSGQFDFALPNPYQTVKSLEHGYKVFGKMADDDNFRGIILVRKDAGIRRVTDLKGKTVCFPAPTALAATLMPQYYLQTHGIDVMKDITISYVGSQESSIMNVFLGNAAAGATWPPPWKALSAERPELAEQLEVMWQTDYLPNNGLVARKDIPEQTVELVSELLLGLHRFDRGRGWLQKMELSKFEAADDATYKPVKKFIAEFSNTVHPL